MDKGGCESFSHRRRLKISRRRERGESGSGPKNPLFDFFALELWFSSKGRGRLTKGRLGDE